MRHILLCSSIVFKLPHTQTLFIEATCRAFILNKCVWNEHQYLFFYVVGMGNWHIHFNTHILTNLTTFGIIHCTYFTILLTLKCKFLLPKLVVWSFDNYELQYLCVQATFISYIDCHKNSQFKEFIFRAFQNIKILRKLHTKVYIIQHFEIKTFTTLTVKKNVVDWKTWILNMKQMDKWYYIIM